jgi:hypothetical protein
LSIFIFEVKDRVGIYLLVVGVGLLQNGSTKNVSDVHQETGKSLAGALLGVQFLDGIHDL